MKLPRNLDIIFIIISFFLIAGWITSSVMLQYELRQSYERENRLFELIAEVKDVSRRMNRFKEDVKWVKHSTTNNRIKRLECQDLVRLGKPIPLDWMEWCHVM